MKAFSDVIIVGGGPCGSFVALNLARFGVAVTVFEEHEEIGVPSHCAGHVSILGLERLGLYPLPTGIVENVFYGANFHSPKGRMFTVRFASPITCVINRTLFDQHVAKMAEKAGACYSLNSRVESLIVGDGFVKGVVTKHNIQTEKRYLAKIVVDAEGISSRILRQAGLSASTHHMHVNAVEAEVENVKETEPDIVEVFLGKHYAPGFYAWLIPKRDGKAKVGLAAKAGDPREFLQRFMHKHPSASKRLSAAKLLQASFHPISLGGPIPKTCSNGFLTVGDAASQVKPTTGGGVIFGMTCAKIAAEIAYEALDKNAFSSLFLSKYQRRCEELLGFDVKVMLKIRRMLDGMSDEKIDEAISFCTKIGLDKVLRNFNDTDFQGKSLMRILWNPRMLATFIHMSLLRLF